MNWPVGVPRPDFCGCLLLKTTLRGNWITAGERLALLSGVLEFGVTLTWMHEQSLSVWNYGAVMGLQPRKSSGFLWTVCIH